MANILFDGLFKHRASSEKAFLHLPDEQSVTYAAFDALSAQLANVFAKSGLRKGDRVALQLAKSPMALAVYAACVRSGCVLIPLNTAYTPSEIDYFVGDATPRLIICDGKAAAELQPIADAVGADLQTLDADGGGSLTEAAARQLTSYEAEYCGPEDLAAPMRLFISGSTPLLAETHTAFEARTGHRILERYGMTETNMNASNPYLGERRPGSVGFALPGVEIRITDASTGEEVAQGQTGIIEVRGPNVFRGYWNMPEKTAEELRDNGFFITGDLGQFDQDGYLHIVGRQKDLIISGGYNIYPKEIEVLLDALPLVEESAVVGIPDADFGEAVIACVVAERGVKLQAEQLLAPIKEHLARFKLPRQIIQIEQLPRNTMGKVQKNVLRERYTGP